MKMVNANNNNSNSNECFRRRHIIPVWFIVSTISLFWSAATAFTQPAFVQCPSFRKPIVATSLPRNHLGALFTRSSSSSSSSSSSFPIFSKQQSRRGAQEQSPLILFLRNPRSKGEENSVLSRLSNPFSTIDDGVALDSSNSNSNSLPSGLRVIQSVAEPFMDALDDSSEFILSYADLRPDSASTLPGQAFLATNLFYGIVGAAVAMQGDWFFGCLTEACAIASYLYHYTQLQAKGETKAPTVRMAVLVDYVLAIISIGVASTYLFTSLSDAPVDVFLSVALSVGFLLLSWLYETGRPYMLFHSLWHIFGAYSGFLIGSLHNHASLPVLGVF